MISGCKSMRCRGDPRGVPAQRQRGVPVGDMPRSSKMGNSPQIAGAIKAVFGVVDVQTF
jgi:hypothetical protein